MKEKRVKYKSDKMIVSFAPEICIHSGVCVRGLPSVFNTLKKPWVNVAGADQSEIISLIEKCPSGALKYELINLELSKGEKMEDKKLESTKITLMPDGPLMVEGNINIVKLSGETVKEGEKFFLCRCGQSSNKPFCDGTHKKIGFKAE